MLFAFFVKRDENMKHTETLKLNREFRRLYYKGKFCARGCIVVYAMKNRRGINRLGLTAGKSVGNAVKRNRAKRLMRESYRLSEDKLEKGFDIVIVARAAINGKKLDKVMRDVVQALEKTNVCKASALHTAALK